MAVRENEDDADRERRMYNVIGLVNDSRVAVQKLAAGNTMWATVSRPRTERGHGSHASKIRRLLHSIGADFNEVDAVYSTGSIWYKDVLVGSVERPRNGAHVRRGKLDHSWIDLQALSDATGVPEAELDALWSQIDPRVNKN